jgi:hypothetical protein
MGTIDQPGGEPRQRWRVVFARASSRTVAVIPGGGRDDAGVVAALERVDLPLARAGARARIALAASLPGGMAAEHELADLILTERRAVADVREAISDVVAPEYRLVDLYDVWLGEPALPAQVAAADYRVVLGPVPGPAGAIAEAAQRLLTSTSLPRERLKGGRSVTYDLRPLLADVAIVDGSDPQMLRIRTRFLPERGTGRPDEVVAALADACSLVLEISSMTRERIWLASELSTGIGVA